MEQDIESSRDLFVEVLGVCVGGWGTEGIMYGTGHRIGYRDLLFGTVPGVCA